MRLTTAAAKRVAKMVEVTVEVAVYDPAIEARGTHFDWRGAAHVANAQGFDVGRCMNNELILTNGQSGVFVLELLSEKFKTEEKPTPEVEVEKLKVKKEAADESKQKEKSEKEKKLRKQRRKERKNDK